MRSHLRSRVKRLERELKPPRRGVSINYDGKESYAEVVLNACLKESITLKEFSKSKIVCVIAPKKGLLADPKICPSRRPRAELITEYCTRHPEIDREELDNFLKVIDQREKQDSKARLEKNENKSFERNK